MQPPQGGKGWEFWFLAAEDIEEGSEATISYGDHSSWSFLLHYGFVPQRNASDTVSLFSNVEEATDWFLDRFPPKVFTQLLACNQILGNTFFFYLGIFDPT